MIAETRLAWLRERMEYAARETALIGEDEAVLVLNVLKENEVLREQMDAVGPASVLPIVARMLNAAGELLRGVVVAEGDSIDHLVTVVEHAANRVEYERKACTDR